MRVCVQCGEDKPLATAYHRDPKSPGGYRRVCKGCRVTTHTHHTPRPCPECGRPVKKHGATRCRACEDRSAEHRARATAAGLVVKARMERGTRTRDELRQSRWHFACLGCGKRVLLPRSRCYGCATGRALVAEMGRAA